ncbi:MAG: glycosyltransferase family 4 protein [Deltaproteobacteria bacterium]|nr:glycosyltransferase family 4 protein [Deltaproteobacteria bacterium]
MRSIAIKAERLAHPPTKLRPRRVLMTADAIGGVWTYAVELAKCLTAHDIEIAVATMGIRPSRNQSAELTRIPRTFLFESDFKLEWMNNPWSDVERAGAWLLDIEDSFRPDIVHLNGYVHAALPWHVPVVVIAHSCVLSWWKAVRGIEAPSEWALYRRLVRLGILAADAVIAPSQAMLKEIHCWYGKPRREAVIPNGRDPHLFRPSEKYAYVFSVGRLWDDAKNISALDAIADELEWPVFIAGDRISPNGDILQMSKSTMLGRLSPTHLSEWLGAAPICTLPARYEPFGLCELEAGLSGCALVLGDIESLRETWHDAALFISPEDHAGLRDALNHLIRSPKLLNNLAQRAYQRALAFDSERMTKAYLEIYRALLAARTNAGELGCVS